MIFLKSHLPSNTLIQLNKARGIDKETFTIEIVTILKRKKKKKKKVQLCLYFLYTKYFPKRGQAKGAPPFNNEILLHLFFFFTLAAKKSE